MTLDESARWCPPLPVALRVLLVLVGLGLSALLVTAAYLRPATAGFGTHQQLGFPPCTILATYNLRCPSCGMTTAWAHTVRGQIPSAVAANSGGALLAILAIVIAPWSLVSALRGRWLGGPPGATVTWVLMVTVIAVTLGDWGVRLLIG